MANLITRDPIELDTTDSVISIGRAQVIIKSVEWVNPLNIGDVAILQDKDGSTICDWTCVVANEGKRSEFGDIGAVFTAPLNLSSLTSGKLLLRRV